VLQAQIAKHGRPQISITNWTHQPLLNAINLTSITATKKIACFTITREFLLVVDAHTTRNHPSPTSRRSKERRDLRHGNNSRPTSTATRSGHDDETAQLALTWATMPIWRQIQEGGKKGGRFPWRLGAEAYKPAQGGRNARDGRGKDNAGTQNPMIPCGIVRDGEPSLLSIACKRKNWDSREGFLPREVATLLERPIQRKALDLAISNRMTSLVEMPLR
jgi:hypothetical protein